MAGAEIEEFRSAVTEGASDIADLLAALPTESVKYSQPDSGGLYSVQFGDNWPGSSFDVPLVQVGREWDFASDELDLDSPNRIYVTARARVESGQGAQFEATLLFAQDSILAEHDDLSLARLSQALSVEELFVESVIVDSSTYPSSAIDRPTRQHLAVTFESGSGYSRVTDGPLVQATEPDFESATIAVTRAVEEVRSSWSDHFASPSRGDDAGRSGATEPDFASMGACIEACSISGSTTFDHPSWGLTALYTLMSEQGYGAMEAHIVAVNSDGRIVWQYDSTEIIEMRLTSNITDNTGHLFVDFNPGRLNGVIVLAATDEGFEDFDTLPSGGEFRTRFYGGYVADVDGDGTHEIIVDAGGCGADCVESSSQVYRWNGSDYLVGT